MGYMDFRRLRRLRILDLEFAVETLLSMRSNNKCPIQR
jgi:hypothetical protein